MQLQELGLLASLLLFLLIEHILGSFDLVCSFSFKLFPVTFHYLASFGLPALCKPLTLLLIELDISHALLIFLYHFVLSLLNLQAKRGVLFIKSFFDFLVDFVVLLCDRGLFPLLEGRHLLDILISPVPFFVICLSSLVELILLLGSYYSKLLLFFLLFLPQMAFLLLEQPLSLPLLFFNLHLLFCLNLLFDGSLLGLYCLLLP